MDPFGESLVDVRVATQLQKGVVFRPQLCCSSEYIFKASDPTLSGRSLELGVSCI